MAHSKFQNALTSLEDMNEKNEGEDLRCGLATPLSRQSHSQPPFLHPFRHRCRGPDASDQLDLCPRSASLPIARRRQPLAFSFALTPLALPCIGLATPTAGRLKDVGKILVDVGTGYVVEKSRNDAAVYIKGKLALLQSHLTNASHQINRAQSTLETINMTLRERVQQAIAASEAQGGEPQQGVQV